MFAFRPLHVLRVAVAYMLALALVELTVAAIAGLFLSSGADRLVVLSAIAALVSLLLIVSPLPDWTCWLVVQVTGVAATIRFAMTPATLSQIALLGAERPNLPRSALRPRDCRTGLRRRRSASPLALGHADLGADLGRAVAHAARELRVVRDRHGRGHAAGCRQRGLQCRGLAPAVFGRRSRTGALAYLVGQTGTRRGAERGTATPRLHGALLDRRPGRPRPDRARRLGGAVADKRRSDALGPAGVVGSRSCAQRSTARSRPHASALRRHPPASARG